MLRALILTGIIIISVAGGFILGMKTEQGVEEQKPVESIVVRQIIEPYTGVGSGVLKHGTIIEGEYTGPESIVGHFEPGTEDRFPGTWVIRKLVTEK